MNILVISTEHKELLAVEDPEINYHFLDLLSENEELYSKSAFDILIIDLDDEWKSRNSFIRSFSKKFPNTKIVCVAQNWNSKLLEEAISLKSMGFLKPVRRRQTLRTPFIREQARSCFPERRLQASIRWKLLR